MIACTDETIATSWDANIICIQKIASKTNNSIMYNDIRNS